MAGVGGAERIFVYGTLRRGGSREAARFFSGVKFAGRARVRGVLYDFGEYPGLRLDAGSGWVRGELLDVSAEALAGMDEWEGIHPAASGEGEYRRVRTTARRDDAAEEACWIYEILADRCAGRPVIASGDWLERGGRS